MAETLKSAVEGIPEASWTGSDGTAWSSKEILSQWSQEQLQQPVEMGEDQRGMTTVRAAGSGETLLTMEEPSGPDIPAPPLPFG